MFSGFDRCQVWPPKVCAEWTHEHQRRLKSVTYFLPWWAMWLSFTAVCKELLNGLLNHESSLICWVFADHWDCYSSRGNQHSAIIEVRDQNYPGKRKALLGCKDAFCHPWFRRFVVTVLCVPVIACNICCAKIGISETFNWHTSGCWMLVSLPICVLISILMACLSCK